jgi:hypothetical protein
MKDSLLLSGYLAVAAVTSVWTVWRGMLRPRRQKLLAAPEYVLLTMTCLGVGAAWPLFVPGAMVMAGRRMGIRRISLPRPGRGKGRMMIRPGIALREGSRTGGV